MCLCGHNSIPVVLLLHGTCCQISVTSCCLTQYVLFCPVNYFILPSISSSTLGSFTSVEKLSVHRRTRVLVIMTNVLSLISCSVHGPENLCFLLWCCSCIKVFNWLSCYPLTSAWYQPSFFCTPTSVSVWLTIILQCCDTVYWVMWPVISSPKWPIICLVGR